MSEYSLENLSGIELLSDLGPGHLKKVENGCSFKYCKAQEQIIEQQSETTDVYFVINGNVRVANYSISGRIISFADLRAGSYFGELSALDSQPRSASILALSNCLLALFPQGQFISLLEDHSSIALKVMRSLGQIVRTSTVRIMDLSTIAAHNRVQADLLRLAYECGGDDRKAEISPIPIHSDIASRVSTSRETVARVLMNLARRGIIERQKKTLVVKDIKQLKNMVEKIRG